MHYLYYYYYYNVAIEYFNNKSHGAMLTVSKIGHGGGNYIYLYVSLEHKRSHKQHSYI